MLRRFIFALLFGLLSTLAAAAQPEREASRGELLYSTHCIACHTTEVHWREKKIAIDWVTLKEQVNRWQGNSSLGWGEEDIAEVARYLNTLYYDYDPLE